MSEQDFQSLKKLVAIKTCELIIELVNMQTKVEQLNLKLSWPILERLRRDLAGAACSAREAMRHAEEG